MPFEKRSAPPPEAHPRLVDGLAAELACPTAEGPRVIEQEVRGLPRSHPTVIWNEWTAVDPADRGGVIPEAYERVFGQNRAGRIPLALGLTPAEATRLGVG